MNLLANEMTEYLASQQYAFDIKFTREFDQTDMTFPRVIITQGDDNTAIRTADDEYLAFVSFQIEIYTKDCERKDGVITNKIDAADEISDAIDKFMYAKYKLNRADVYTNSKYTVDVVRKVLRYDGFIDRYGYTYRTL